MVEAKKTHMTMIFTAFVFLNFFNLINCRVIGATDYNIFTKFFGHKQMLSDGSERWNINWVYLLVLVTIFLVQLSACEWFLFLFETVDISGEQFGQCVLSGATVMIAAFALKLTPAPWVEKLPIKIDEE